MTMTIVMKDEDEEDDDEQRCRWLETASSLGLDAQMKALTSR